MQAIIVAHTRLGAVLIANRPTVVAGSNSKKIVSYRVKSLKPLRSVDYDSDSAYVAEVQELTKTVSDA